MFCESEPAVGSTAGWLLAGVAAEAEGPGRAPLIERLQSANAAAQPAIADVRALEDGSHRLLVRRSLQANGRSAML